MVKQQTLIRPLWLVVLAAAAAVGVAMGLRQVMGLYMKPMTLELGLGRQAFSLAIAVANIVWGIAAPFTGAFTDTHGTGRVLAAGGVAMALGLVVMAEAKTEATLLASGVLLGLGVACAGVNALVGTVARQAPPESRGAAVAALGMGSGVGILLALPYTYVLIGQIGWQPSLYVLAATSLAILPLALLVAGKPAAPAPDVVRQDLGAALKEAFGLRDFWLLTAGFFVCGFHVVFYGTHLPAFVADKGLPEWVATWALMLVGVGNLIGTYLAGQWARVWPKRYGLVLIYLGRALVFLGFLVLPVTPVMVLVLSAALGLLWLSTIPLTSTLVSTFFGPAWMTMLYGIVFLSHQAGSFLGVWLGGVVFDTWKSYDLMWVVSIGLGLLAALVNWPIRERLVTRPGAGAAIAV